MSSSKTEHMSDFVMLAEAFAGFINGAKMDRLIRVTQYGRTYTAPCIGYYAKGVSYVLAELPRERDFMGVRILQDDGSIGLVLRKEVCYEELPKNLIHG